MKGFSRFSAILFFLVAISFFRAAAQGPQDLPFGEEQLRQYSGFYNITAEDSEEVIMQIRLFSADGQLFGQIDDNEPTRMMQQQNHLIRPQAATDWLITLSVEDDVAKSLSISSPIGFMNGIRVEAIKATEITENISGQWAGGGLTSGALFDELTRLDSLLFNAAFVACDTEIRNSLFTGDVEFYHDIEGLSIGDDVRAPITNCPGDRGVIRRLVEGSLNIYPLHEYGAIQMGEHLFIEENVPMMTIAKFVHVWQQNEDDWKIARILSFDHKSVPKTD